jgi:hypothetical protein
MARASCSVIARCALVGGAKAATKPTLIRIGTIVRFIARSTVSYCGSMIGPDTGWNFDEIT